jgi:hypothetical protein
MNAMGGLQPVKTMRKKKHTHDDFSVGKGITSQKVSLLQKLMHTVERHFLDTEVNTVHCQAMSLCRYQCDMSI